MKEQKNSIDVYLYGMTVFSNLYMLDAYPKPDTYGEILETYQVTGGEVGNSAIVLSNLGYQVKIDGPYLGVKTKEGILKFMSRFNIDCQVLFMIRLLMGLWIWF